MRSLTDSEAREVLKWVDPDYLDHFQDPDQAVEFYKQHSPHMWRDAVRDYLATEEVKS